MKLADSLIFSLTVALFLIGIDQTFRVGITQSYWIFMASLGCLMWYRYRKTSNAKPKVDQVEQPTKRARKKQKPKRTKKR